MLVSKSSFYNSYSSQSGGSIYVKEGSCIQYRICSISSTIPDKKGNGCHSYVNTTKGNYIIESSISRSKGFACCVILERGRQLIDSTNISYAKCRCDSAYYCYKNPSSHLINFTTILNNTAESLCVMYHYENSQFVLRCNIINNILNRNWDSYGIVYDQNCKLNLSFCVFSSNSGQYLFRNDNGELNVDQCFFNNKNVDETKTSYIGIIFFRETAELVLNLAHLTTKDCEADFPLNNQLKNSRKSKFMKILFSLIFCFRSR